ncbi:ca[2+] channel Muscle-specific alpha2/delta subunit isoform X2 [Lycorma delicatula]|uniref:ca[2+] channel Muscle-specific alpha2/delta subunit isoform X2 n=1 Tax=Lycorma delicatula TaxID=130591 RepID=UPI003F5100BD
MFGSAVIICVLLAFVHQSDSNKEEIVETWAAKLGEELWELGTLVTRIPEIKSKYKFLNARVLPTNGEAILNSMVANINRMLKQKMDAVMCIIKAAEELSENFEYNSSSLLAYHGSKVSVAIVDGNTLEPNDEYIVPRVITIDELKPEKISANYLLMELANNSHFYGIPVNTSYSAVHVPTDVFDQGYIVKEHIQWSEGLDEVFVRNYMSDPTLKWQYFGSSTGFLRHYPALKWKESLGREIDEFDCRTRPWFIEAATCSKDVVILVDTSGSMRGMSNTTARLTVKYILDTFSNNDFINIFTFSNVTKNIVPCFSSDMLVQATEENVQTFKEAVDNITVDGKANFSNAYITAFNLLEQYRQTKACPEKTCNQAIMLITDSVTDNLTEVFQQYNWFENRTHIPVRVFTYLIGLEVTKVREIQWMACLNRGYYVHIQTLEEVRSQVLKYIPVIARPLVLQEIEHPLSWTHPFADITDEMGKPRTDFQEYRMMTAVSGPAYDKKKNKNNETKSADLLGIAGTDVNIRDIERLTLPYKIGANGYAFVITNNGYLLLHPDSRPVYKGYLKDNYNSVDLTEVELLDDDNLEPREPSPEILRLREKMIEHKEGKTKNLTMKFHYDDFRRVGSEIRHYYYAPLENTPFTLGLVLPHSYGNFWIKAGDEIKKTFQMGASVTDYFKGNWRVHPNWVYCDYHRASAHSNESREERLLGFMKQMRGNNWKWHEQYPDPKKYESEDVCKRRPIGDDEYYCDKELMQLLVFDAKSTQLSYETKKYIAKSRRELELVTNYKVNLRFVATQSGLTRWQYISEQPDDKTEWGDSNNEALNEPWYRSAVLQHHIDADSFVFSVPFDAGQLENITVTASHAIFPRDGGHEAPGSVVGILFPHETLFSKFNSITSKSNCADCDYKCSSDSIDCYVIDGNAYIVISETKELTGHFFGEVEGAIMDAMVSKNIFRRIRMFDYQGLCFDYIFVNNTASYLLTPIHHIIKLGQWLIGNLLWFLLETVIYRPVFADEDYFDSMTIDSVEVTTPSPKKRVRKKPSYNKTIVEACDRKGDLYLLQHLSKEGYHSSDIVNCSRPFFVERIAHTNLLLIVVDALHQSCYSARRADMERIEYNNFSQSCQKLYLNTLPRRRLSGCFNEHPLENEIITCGRATNLNLNWITLIFIMFQAILAVINDPNIVK